MLLVMLVVVAEMQRPLLWRHHRVVVVAAGGRLHLIGGGGAAGGGVGEQRGGERRAFLVDQLPLLFAGDVTSGFALLRFFACIQITPQLLFESVFVYLFLILFLSFLD